MLLPGAAKKREPKKLITGALANRIGFSKCYDLTGGAAK
jgi:hypothetical protein